jgi:tetratricopeptide (TPR) repeat protein
VKLLDFGLAHLTSVPPDPEAPSLLHAGTPAYMAPEQHLGKPQSPCTDIWAAGLMFYEMLAGQPPYPDVRGPERVARTVSPESVPSIRLVRPELPEELDRLLAAALAKDPARRLRSSHELLQRLRELEERLLPAEQPARALPPERRQVTLLACTLSELPWNDEEKAYELLEAYQKGCSRIVHRHGGTISVCMSEEVLALFGYPRARDEDSLHAVFAARALQEELKAELRRLAPGCALKIGIHTGLSLLSAGPDGTISVQGEAPHVALDLARLAKPDTVMLSDATQVLVRGVFKLRELEDRGLGGVAGGKRQRLYQLVRERKVRFRFAQALAAGGLTPMVGRQPELEVLARLWGEARRGRGAAVLVTGEAGVGKSRLCQELQRRLPPRSYLPIIIQCWSQVENSAFAPIIDFFNYYFDFTTTDTVDERLRKLRRTAPLLGISNEEAQLLSCFLALPIPEDSPLHAVPREKRKERTLELVATLLRREAEEVPIILVVEDLHWADPSTLQLLDVLVEKVRDLPVLMLLTARPEFPAAFKSRPWLHPLVLERLDTAQTEALIQAVTQGRELPSKLVGTLTARTAGVPLFVEELTRAALAQHEETGAMAELPATLAESLSARLDRLPGRLKSLVVRCAVAGISFSPALVAPAFGPDEPSSVEGELQELIEVGFLQREEHANEPVYRFRHPLLQEAAYGSQPRGVRRDRHGRLARVLQERFPKLVDTQPELLAHHLTEAGRTEEAIRHWVRASELASRRSAYVEAAGHLHRALELLQAQPRPSETARELPLLLALGLVQTEYLGYASAEVDRTYTRVRRLLDQPDAMATEQELSFWGLFSFYFARADFEIARQVGARMVEFGERLRKPHFLAVGHRMLATVYFTWGQMDRALEEVEHALAHAVDRDVEQHRTIARRQAMAEKHWVDSAVMALAYAAIVHSAVGQPDQACTRSEEAVALAERIGHPFTLCYALTYTALAALLRHEAEEVECRSERAVALAHEHRFLLWAAWARLFDSWAESAQGQPTKGVVELRAAMDRWVAAGFRAGMPHNLGMLADMHLRAGELSRGLDAVQQGLDWVGRTGECSYEVELHRLRGELLRRQGDERGARLSFLKALDVARRQGAGGFGLRAANSLARQLSELGQAEQARLLLEHVLEELPPSTAPDFDEARALLAMLREQEDRRPPA